MNASKFTKLIQFSFRESYDANKEIISQLKESLLKCKQENYLLKNKATASTSQSLINSSHPSALDQINSLNHSKFAQSNENLINKFQSINQYTKMKQNYEQNIEFLTNLIKLKIIGKNFQLDENVETIIATLRQFLEQIRYFFLYDHELLLERDNDQIISQKSQSQQPNCSLDDSGINFSYSSSYFDSTLNKTKQSLFQVEPKQQTSSFEKNEEIIVFKFPYDSLVHALQIFLNIFQIEWLYYLRSNLLDSLNDFIDELVKFILECDELSQVCQVFSFLVLTEFCFQFMSVLGKSK